MKRCETCKYWELLYYEDSFFTEGPTNDKGDPNKKSEYGQCTNPENIFDCGDNNFIELTKRKTPMLIFDIERYYGSILDTHKDHCCKCWQGKEG